MKILMVLTPHDRLGETGNETGVGLDEFTGQASASSAPAARQLRSLV